MKLEGKAHFHPQSLRLGLWVVFFFKIFFDVDYFKVFVECATILLLLLLMFWIFDFKACGILVPNQGSNLHPLCWKVWF